ncbi:MAG: TetR/AcrR family transcriptional regulator [Sulfuriferula sp.]|nr:TetR/AcrR family transcriptional regulator [Sulfuriferula sp.]
METTNPDLTRNKLLNAAFCEMHRQGYQGTSIADILQQTALTKGALYHHFPTKHALGLAVIDEVIAPFLSQKVIRPLYDSPTPITTLLDILSRAGELGDEGIMLGCPLNNLMQEMSPLDEQFRHQLNNVLEIWQLALHDALITGQQQKIIKPDIDIAAAALFIVSAWEGCYSIAKNKQSPAAFKSCMTQLKSYIHSLCLRDLCTT